MPKEPLSWKTERRRVNDLLPHKKNPRTLSPEQMEALKKSLQIFGLAEIPAIDTKNRLLAGHQRIKVLQLLGRGEEIIDVRVPIRPLTEKEANQYLLTSNAVHGSWDYDLLRAFDTDLLLEIGFGDEDLSRVFDDVLETEDDEFDTEKELAKIKKPKTKPGDLIQLGAHRLLCGNSEDPKAVARLMGNGKADVLYTDWPYNISLDYGKGLGGKKDYGGTMDDSKTDTEYKAFLLKCLANAKAHLKPDAHLFSFCDQSYIWLLQESYRELGITNRRVCLWMKNASNPTPKVAFNKAYEPIVYGTIGKPHLAQNVPNLNEIMNKEVGNGNRLIDDILDLWDVWLVKRLSSIDYEHPTQKPPTLHEKPFRRCTKPGDLILDLCGGSGSTLVAAEQMKRKAYLLEIEPIFCDLIINRYEKLTNDKGKRLN